MNFFVNIHTHTAGKNTNICINNLNFDSKLTISQSENHFFSFGLHPWDVENANLEHFFLSLEQQIQKKSIVAVGEIGLDKAVVCDFSLQSNVFLEQLKLAQKFNFPVIIHCVKAYLEILEILKKQKVTIPIIFHQFMGNYEIYRQLIKFNSYFSFGKNLFLEKAKFFQYFDKIELSRVFFETDDSEISIESVYEQASKLLNLDIEILKAQAYQNFNIVFRIK